MFYRRLAGVLGAVVAVTAAIPVTAHGAPPTKCLTNTPKGKQVYVPCDLLNAGANFPPGQRCPPPLEQYPKDVADWCGEGPGLASTTPSSPTSTTSPTSPTSSTSPARPTTTSASPTSAAAPTTTPPAPTTAPSAMKTAGPG
ncbi:hypothetical protein [Mycobacterium malmoense]|uniref:hypothetical protein n=1 Tax=Mycobacterium malmoense TaxID=1780 RepID=UPI0011465C28|nr:hypothetical protein [Mycobacterium malmoense]